MKNTEKGFVQIPTQTLNALKNMLFANENTVDLTNIINDLTVNESDRDLMAIHVALAHKGVSIDIDKSARYEKYGHNHIIKHEFVGYSLIIGCVHVQSYDCHIDETGDLVIDHKYEGISGYPFSRWEEWVTNVADIIKKDK